MTGFDLYRILCILHILKQKINKFKIEDVIK